MSACTLKAKSGETVQRGRALRPGRRAAARALGNRARVSGPRAARIELPLPGGDRPAPIWDAAPAAFGTVAAAALNSAAAPSAGVGFSLPLIGDDIPRTVMIRRE